MVLAVLVFIGVVLIFLVHWLFRRKPKRVREEPELRINVTALPLRPLPKGPTLLFHGEPMRLDIVVVAPSGRDRQLPPRSQWPSLMEAVVPGLGDVLTAHETQILPWPPQLSIRGFIHLFFRNAVLPGDRGRGTPFCAVAGPARDPNGQIFLVGMIMHADHPIFLSYEEVESDTGWRRLLEVRS